jgi:hypothetical protein
MDETLGDQRQFSSIEASETSGFLPVSTGSQTLNDFPAKTADPFAWEGELDAVCVDPGHRLQSCQHPPKPKHPAQPRMGDPDGGRANRNEHMEIAQPLRAL